MSNLATWFTPSLQTISRSAGRSSVLAAAYRACAALTDERLGISRDFTPKGKHGLAENICIGIPNNDIGKLFNDAEKAETRANSTVARELMIPLPSAWTDAERAQCARGLGEMLRARYGVAVLVSIHRPSKDNNNDHVHILFTTREVDADGKFGKKTRILDDAKTGEVKKLRETVCEIVNVQAKAQGDDWYVYAGKFSDIIEDYVPTKHISIRAGKNQKARIDANRNEVAEARKVLAKTKADIAAIDVKIEALQKLPTIEESSLNAVPMPDKSDKGVTVSKPLNKQLQRIQIPETAELARKQIEDSLISRKILHQEYKTWEDMKTQLLTQPPIPEYGFFGRQTRSYKNALSEHNKNLQLAEEGMVYCTERAEKIMDYIQDPERQRLNALYKETVLHNAKVDAYDKQIAEQTATQHQHAIRWAEQNPVRHDNALEILDRVQVTIPEAEVTGVELIKRLNDPSTREHQESQRNQGQEVWADVLGMSDEDTRAVAQAANEAQNGGLVSVDRTQDASSATGSLLGTKSTHKPDEDEDSYHA